jgi:hypothetical protein
VKFNATTGAIMWKLAVAGATGLSYDTSDMSKNIIKNGTLYYLGDNSKSCGPSIP